MRIGIDCRTILNPEKGEGAGVGHYTYQLVRHLLAIDKENDYFLFFDRTVEKQRLNKFKQKNVSINFFPFIQYKKFMPGGYSHFLISAFISRFKLDVLHSPTLNLPPSYRGNTVVTAHDLAVYKLPELYTKKQIALLKSIVPSTVTQANKIIAASESTKKDLVDIFGVEKNKITVIYHGVDKRFSAKSGDVEVKRVKSKLHLQGNYLLFLGMLEKRKNIIRIVEAFERLKDKLSETSDGTNNYQLVLAGPPGHGFQEIKNKIKQSKYKNQILTVGYIQPDDLDPLYEGARVLVFPTLYEGFGLPVIEAMANGLPVITSNISSLPEAADDQALLVDPYNVSEIFHALWNVLTDVSLWRRLSQGGVKRADGFDWTKTAQETLRAYRQVAR
jgi:glycosyltransferase involved in cell wall biosynthesis